MTPKFRLAIFASGSGTNAEQLFAHFKNNDQIEVALLLSNNPSAYVLQRAVKANVKAMVFDKNQLREGDVLNRLSDNRITHIVLAGFLWLIPDNLIKSFRGKIINIHPALLPKYGGKGMYGSKVHEAIKTANETETGITIHLVNEHYDKGDILFQAKINIHSNDTPDQIATKVHELEYKYYPIVVEHWILGKGMPELIK